MQLYKIDNQILQAISAANPETGEVDFSLLDQLEMTRVEKQHNVILYVKDVEMGLASIEDEIKRLRDMAAVADKKVEWLKQYLKSSMELMGEKEIKFGPHYAKIRNNPVSVNIIDESAIPKEFTQQVISTKIDKTSIKEAIQAGVEVTGAELIQKTRLDIK